jgi:hypothetical protein
MFYGNALIFEPQMLTAVQRVHKGVNTLAGVYQAGWLIPHGFGAEGIPIAIGTRRFRADEGFDFSRAYRADESGGKHAAVRTLRAGWGVRWSRQRLECGDFSTALMRTNVIHGRAPRARAKAVSPLPSALRFDAARRSASTVHDAGAWLSR